MSEAVETIEVKASIAVDDAGSVTGIAWPFGSPDMVGDVIEKGAFKIPSRVPMLFAHEQAQAIGVWDEILESAEGLTVKGRLLVDDVARAREVRALAKEGAASGLSIGFVTRKAKARSGGGRVISALDLHEISIVPIPSHPRARITRIKEARNVAEENDEIVLDDRVDAMETDVAAIKADIAELKGGNEETGKILKRIELKLGRPAARSANEDENEPPLERKAFVTFLKGGREAMALEEVKALTVADDTSGGYLAPAEFSTEVVKGIVEFSPVRQAARVGNTSSGSVILPKRTGRPTAHWVGETEDREETGSTYGQVDIPIHEMACYVDVSLRLLEDAAINVEAEVASDLAEEFGRLEGHDLLLGDGAKKPMGLMEAPGVAYTPSGNASTLGSNPADLLITHLYSVPAFYRNSGAWMMNGTTLAAIRKLKDGVTGIYLWQPSYAAGQPETILGRPVIEAPDMDDIGSDAEPIAFGNFAAAYRIYDRVALSVMRDPYSQATKGIVRFHARRRMGGGLVLPEAVKKIRCAIA